MRRPRTLRPLHPNQGLAALYRAALLRLVDEMAESVGYLVRSIYRANPPRTSGEKVAEGLTIAQDADPPKQLPAMTARQIGTLQRVEFGERRIEAKRADQLERKGLIRAKEKPKTGVASAVEWELTDAGRAFLDSMLSPTEALAGAVEGMAARWQAQFDLAAPRLAEYFSTEVAKRSDAALRSILRDGGFSVRFQPSAAMTDAVEATVGANVSLIRTIPQQYLAEVEGLVMRSVQAGRDLSTLTKELRHRYALTRRRASLIARDQNNKATSAMTRARQVELGLYKARWLHSGGGKHPRPKHVKASGAVYDVRKGLKIGDRGQWVQPGEEINCRCVSQTIVPGFE